jgi:preprotein translocase subunit SecA
MSDVTTATKAQIETDYTRDDVMTAEEDTVVISCYFLSC